MNRHYKYEFKFEGWQSWAILIFAGIGIIDVCKETGKLIASYIY